jgi:histidine triad (HIT) family protein
LFEHAGDENIFKGELTMADCIFCKIAEKEIPSNVVYEDDKILCFHDLDPQAPVHVLIIPKKHIASMDDVQAEDQELLGYIMTKVKEIAKTLGLENGYRLVNNCGEDGGQTVGHIHFHLLARRNLAWPPG